ncbi:hypothetical protein [Caldicellulosiruptor bescii]|uniref:hypothetical protein n=1 Tax=Caldicellulosiruptor bescii TaxID=31899 RepID=UPI000C0234AB|nr:hypothetical protein [Caldicellulosiruptor bescii]PFH17042.1 hypothetical protein B0S93_0828 [Caldicellulosiruptor bescii]
MFETSAMKELHRIQEEIYEETKDMTPEELIRYFEETAKKVERELEELKKKKRKKLFNNFITDRPQINFSANRLWLFCF